MLLQPVQDAMPTLHETQRALCASLLHGAPPPAELSAKSAARLAVYRGNVFSTLTAALRLSFPAVARLVGAECFDGWTMHFIIAKPPRSGDLYEYGEDFADYLATAPAMRLAWLPDVARLEWAINRALASTTAPGLDPNSLAGLTAGQVASLRLLPCPGLSLLALEYPAEAIWRAVLEDDEATRDAALAAIDPATRYEQVAVLPGPDGFTLLQLCPDGLRLARALAAGQHLADALEAVPADRAARLLGELIGHALFTAAIVENPS